MLLKTIRSDNYTAVIDPTRGANCIALREERLGVSVLRERPPISEVDNPFLYGMPILFPVNRISGGEFTFEGRVYRFPINEAATGCHLHGELHGMPFLPVVEDPDRIVCVYRADAEHPYLAFPHAFTVRTEYRLGKEGLMHTVEVVNESDTAMPCLLGFHTTFRVPFAGECDPAAIAVQVDLSEEYERDMSVYLPTGKKPPLDAVSQSLRDGTFCPLGTPVSRHYRAAEAGKITLTDRSRGIRVIYEPDPKLAFRLVYNGTADGYICIEPQTSLANSPNAPLSREEAGFFTVAPHASAVFTSRISVRGDA